MTLLNAKAPSFTLIDTKTKPVSLSEQLGTKIVIAFYPAAFSGICDEEMCTFQSSIQRLNDANATVFGISPDSPFANAKFAEVYGLSFPLLSDLHLEAARAFGVEFPNFAFVEGYTACNRAVFIVDEKGTIIYEWIGEHPGMTPDYEEVLSVLD
jgi:peroxiredoxin